MADPAAPAPAALEWRERKEPREWFALGGAGGEYGLVVMRAYDCPVSLVELRAGAGYNTAYTAKAYLYRRRPEGTLELLREGWADTVVEAKDLAAAWLERLLAPRDGAAGAG